MKLDLLKTLLQQHFTDGLVSIVGSGLSCAEGLPGMGALADHLANHLADLSDEDRGLWDKILVLIRAKGLEAALLECPPSLSLEAHISTVTANYILACEREVAAKVFSGETTLRLTRLVPHLLKPASGIPIITTNYDRLVEIALEEAGLGVDTMFIGHFAGALDEKESRLSFCREVTIKSGRGRLHYRSHAVVCKPHGSLDWYHRAGKPVRYTGDLPGLSRLIIPPGRNKFRNGYDSPFDKHRERANAAIDKASRFIIIGYGFNDEHLETHLTPSVRSGKPTLMLTHTLSPNAIRLARECRNVIAADYAEVAGTPATRVFVNGEENIVPNTSLWDVNSFIDEVLEP